MGFFNLRMDVKQQAVDQVIQIIERIQSSYSPAAFACSFGLEDMVLLDLIAKRARSIEVFVLDTGRLHSETYSLMEAVRNQYGVPIRVYCPDTQALEKWIEENGPNAFYNSVSQRKQCCHIRKVIPLQRALSGKGAWITGLRREQSVTRTDLQVEEWDDANRLQKFNPLLEWTFDDVWSYVRQNRVPYNALHDRGFPSIGCAPCTRAIVPGEDLRAGRWWWEGRDTKECGLHIRHEKDSEELKS